MSPVPFIAIALLALLVIGLLLRAKGMNTIYKNRKSR